MDISYENFTQVNISRGGNFITLDTFHDKSIYTGYNFLKDQFDGKSTRPQASSPVTWQDGNNMKPQKNSHVFISYMTFNTKTNISVSAICYSIHPKRFILVQGYITE